MFLVFHLVGTVRPVFETYFIKIFVKPLIFWTVKNYVLEIFGQNRSYFFTTKMIKLLLYVSSTLKNNTGFVRFQPK